MEKTNDVLAYLEAILRRNTAHYQSGFDYDRQMLRGAANKAKESERTFYWMSRDCGTWCFQERDVFLRDSEPNITWLSYEDVSGILTFRVLITGLDESGEKLTGIIQPFPYAEQVQRVKRAALPIHRITGVYGDGTPFVTQGRKYDPTEMHEHKGIREKRYEPENEQELSNLILWEHREQDKKPQHRKPTAKLR